MTSPIALIAAPSCLGLSRPDGRVPRVDLLPEALLEAGLGRRLGVTLETTVRPRPYVPERDPVVGVHNAPGIVDMAHRLADVVEAARRASRVPVVLGGDCSILLGCLLGLKRTGSRHGLAFLDGHTDFWPPAASPLGGVAGMDLWFATGRGSPVLSNLEGRGALVHDSDVAVLGVRDADDWSEAEHARDTAMLYLDLATLRRDGIAASMERTLARLDVPFWIHLDADVMDDAVMPAVDSRQPGGLRPAELGDLLARLVGSRRVAGVDVTIYDPSLDPERTAAHVLADVLVHGLAGLASPARTRQA